MRWALSSASTACMLTPARRSWPVIWRSTLLNSTPWLCSTAIRGPWRWTAPTWLCGSSTAPCPTPCTPSPRANSNSGGLSFPPRSSNRCSGQPVWRRETMLETCFQGTSRCEGDRDEEEWFIHYMLGKIAEKRKQPPGEYIQLYKQEAARYTTTIPLTCLWRPWSCTSI
ncbi:unnamed protein product [Oncorhynchus mykiss]|uniref:Uncharacterized protein n=1 Tax=Oncorhynchus mykiss TaxID=8022 RepID=A0A060YA61_ONCMY|nr:unnamed protein product [Oncorhynchus mykiss]